MVELINESGSETATSQFLKVGANETKIHFQFSKEFVIDTKTKKWQLGLHQAHDSEGKALEWDPIKGEFDGEISFIQDSEGNSVYKEATITVYDLAIGLISPDKKTTNAFIVSVNAHENEHDLNKEDIKAIKGRQEGVKNDRDVEGVATEIGKRVIREINGSK